MDGWDFKNWLLTVDAHQIWCRCSLNHWAVGHMGVACWCLPGFIIQLHVSPVSLVLFGGISYQHERHGLSSVINWTILICIKSRPSRDYADSHMAPWSVNWPCHIHHAPRGLVSIGKKKKKVWDLSTWRPSMDLVCVHRRRSPCRTRLGADVGQQLTARVFYEWIAWCP